ncbi:MAG: glycosyltransferase family protein, partial [Anaerolineales bacterium]
AALPQTPDLYVCCDPGGRYFPRGVEDLPIPTACYLVDVHLGTWRQQVAQFFDAVFIAQKDYLDRFRQAVGHGQVYWLPLAAAPDIYQQPVSARDFEVGFVGNLALAHRRTARARRLRLIAERFRTNDFYRAYTHAELSQVYSRSQIVFNTTIAGDVSLRLFEGATCSALMLTDSEANGLGELFDMGREVVVYHDDADLLDKITYYLAHEVEREQIARAGQARVLAQHTYPHRAQQLLETLPLASWQRLAPLRRAGANERLRMRREVYIHLHLLDPVLDDARASRYNPMQRAWSAFPALIRRLLI